ncbi:MAG: pyridoxamine 5'-phosphate oxidase family protein, partial [Janthinobacterium lividum]
MDDGNAAETKLWKLIEDIRVAMLTTEAGGSLESRPMSAYVDKEERIIWFLTRIDSGKTGEIADDA